MRLKIEKAITDAMGLAHDENGKIVLVSGALPGEVVECSLLDSGRGVAKAEAVSVLDPSPLRIAPYCPYYSICGGCSFQIVSEKDSAAIKEDIVKDNLLRIAKVDELPPFEAAVYGSFARYRHRARFHVSIRDRKWGFMAKKSNEIVRIESCPLLSSRLDALLGDGREILSAARSAIFENRTVDGRAEVSAFEGDDEVSLGDRSVAITVGDIPYLVSANVFFQSNPRLMPDLLSFVHDNTIGNTIMDLYSGVGTFSAIFEGEGKKVYAVERERRCLVLSRKNAPSALSFTSDVALWGKKSGARPDTIIVDPPRTGIARDALSLILSFGAERIIYVSCNSATAARDIGMMDGYGIDKARVFDFYPGSGHEESAFVLSRR